ncbi:5234_t:CDS:2 [Racocetra fulgida]|uniref:5234_t:CDS:1 n=1 Tax=Racocetra fulgida TaxID=60492 RepID=A0A9N9BJ34_9GLOM|nr:5234_t:CDS:2 [Racocetra fulgida]
MIGHKGYNSESTSQECSPYILQPTCNNASSDDRWHGYFTATEGLVFNQTAKRYGMYFTINIDDPRYVRDNDKGMLIKAFDSEFNPITVPLSVNESAHKIDALASTNQTITGQQFYANLFVGTMNWFQNVETEGKLVSFYYMMLIITHPKIPSRNLGFAPVHPWGLCQSFFMRRRIKQELHKKQYPKAIPLLEQPRTDETLTERINYLEQFLKQFFCDVSFMEEIKEENGLEDAVETVGKYVKRADDE